jgi:hypothetical protein
LLDEPERRRVAAASDRDVSLDAELSERHVLEHGAHRARGHDDMTCGAVLIGVNMVVTGFVAYDMTKDAKFLYADVARGAALLVLLCAYHHRYYRLSREHLRNELKAVGSF